MPLFLAHEHLHRAACQVEVLAEFVLQEALVWILDVLRQVAEERECRESGRKLGHILDFHQLALPHRRWIILDFRKHCIHELGSAYLARVIVPYVCDLIQHIQDSLLLQHGCEDDRHVIERSDSCFQCLGIFRHRVALFSEEVPLVHYQDTTLSVLLDEVEDIPVLCLHTCGGIDHHDADIAVLDGPDGTHHGVELQVLIDPVLLADAGSVHEHELVAELVVIG